MNVNKPIDKINIGYNKSNEEYIELLGEKNKLKKELEKSKEYQERKKIKEKEAGFNIHINGANEERIKEQRRQEILRNQQRAHSSSNQQSDGSYQSQINQQKVRRMWKNPNSVEGRQDNSIDQKYTNPFDISGYDKKANQPVVGQKSPPKNRKRWGNNNVFEGLGQPPNQPTKAIHKNKDEDDDDDDDEYSDSFEEIQQDFEDDEDKDEKDYSSSGIQDECEEKDPGSNEIEQFLKTATMNDITALRESLSNFGELAKQINPKKDYKKDDEDYIEEEFEELIETDEDGDSEEERKFEEQQKQEQLRQQQIKQSQVLISQNTARGAKNRPISATYSLATSIRVQTQRNDTQPSNIIQPVHPIAQIREPRNPNQLSTNYLSNPLTSSQLIQETPKQPNDVMKKPINTNPFKRPFSQNVPKREPVKVNQEFTQREEVKYKEESKFKPSMGEKKTKDDSASKVPIQQILQKIEQLEEWQKEKLMDILNNFDNLTSSQVKSQVNQFDATKQQSITKPSHVKNLDLDFLSPSKKDRKVLPNFSNPNKTEVVIRVLKTYGNPHLCGLTEIELFDENAKKLTIVPAQIIPRNLGNGPKITTARLIDGHNLTNNEKHMWIGYLPLHPKQLEIVIELDKGTKLGGMKIWNYNKSAIDCTKGIKEVIILIDGEEVWQGMLENGRGSISTEYATFIKLKDGIDLPREIQKKTKDAIDEEYEYEESKDLNTQSQIKQSMNQEEMKKFRSEAVLKNSQVQDKSPIWLSSNIASQATLAKDHDRFQQRTQQSQRKQVDPSYNTFDLLDQYQFNSKASQQSESTQISRAHQKAYPHSAVGSSRPHQLRDQHKNVLGSSNFIKPNVGQASQLSTSNRTKQTFDYHEGQLSQQNSNKQWTQPFQVQRQNPMAQNQGKTFQETSDAIQKAVNRVNQITNQQQQQQANKRKPSVQVEESLDNLEFFKATNRGRLMKFNEDEKQTEVKPKPQRKQWGQSPAKSGQSSGLQESQLSASKQRGAHVIVKNPFPDKDLTGSGVKMSARKNKSKDGDFLDQFLNQNKQSEISTSRFHHLQVGLNDQQKQSQKQHSVSPQRESHQQNPKFEQDRLSVFSEPFYIPNLPTGQKLHFNILSTWGDMNYVGLTGIEIFDIEGQPVNITSDQIQACPPDINILPSYGGDPRTVDKLVDGHYLTNDDLHVWLTPFTSGEDHTITIDMTTRKQISMIRIWNYNKSRIHSYRGARLIECQLDGKLIFRGEIQKAPGNLNDPENCCEIILFTDNDAILQRIDSNDWINEKFVKSDMEDTQKILQDVPSYLEERPMTATKKFSTQEMQEIQRQYKQQKPTSLFDDRPQTSAIVTGDQKEECRQSSSLRSRFDQRHQELSEQVRHLAQGGKTSIVGRVIELNIVESWGDLFYVGLTGLEVLDDRGNSIPLTLQMIDADPRDMNSIPGHGSDYRTLDKLLNGVNNTMDDHHMWLIPFNKGENHTIMIDLGRKMAISGLKFYNYNKSEEDTLRGAKQVIIQVDKKFVTPKKGITLRKAPGLVHSMLDMGQIVKLPYKQGWTTDQIVPLQRSLGELGLFQEYELVNLPVGFLYRFNLYSTHGDFYYIGLNGIEFYDQLGNALTISKIFADPEGVHKLPGMQGDIRVVENLINGVNQTFEEQNMWLAPFKNTRSYSAVNNNNSNATGKQRQENSNTQEYRVPNYVYVMFDQPTAVSAIRLWNYTKTPARGVNEFEILVDDKQIYRGFAKIAPEKSHAGFNQDFSTTVLFTSEAKIVDKFKNSINYDTSKQQNVILVNEKKLMNKNQMKPRPNEEFVFNDMQRPTTMAKRL